MWAHSSPVGVVYDTKTASLNVIPGQVDFKHISNKLIKSQHDQATPLASTRGVVYVECGSVKLWAHSSPAGVVYTPKLQVSMSYMARWISNTCETGS